MMLFIAIESPSRPKSFSRLLLFPRPAEPSERGPRLKICLNRSGALFKRHLTSAKCAFERVSEFFAFTQSLEHGEFFRLDAAEIHGIVDPVHNEVNRLRLELRGGANMPFLTLFGEGVAGEIGVFVFFADGKKKVVDGIREIEQPDVWLQLKRECRSVGAGEIFGAQRGLGFVIEGFDVSPLKPSDVEREDLVLPCPLGMGAQPRFHLRAEVAKRERNGWAIDDVGLAHRIELLFTEDGTQARKIFAQRREQAEPILPIVDFEAFE